jgi:hypothetical protein
VFRNMRGRHFASRYVASTLIALFIHRIKILFWMTIQLAIGGGLRLRLVRNKRHGRVHPNIFLERMISYLICLRVHRHSYFVIGRQDGRSYLFLAKIINLASALSSSSLPTPALSLPHAQGRAVRFIDPVRSSK